MSNKKNLLIYAHYYIPDTASTGQILRELAEGMLDKFNITVICVVPSYLGTIEDEEQNFVQEDGTFKPPICVRVTTKLLKDQGLRGENIIQKIQDVTVYPTDYFCPLKMGTNKLTITENTYSIHHYAASWYTGNALVRKIKYYLIPVKIFVKRYILRREE